MFPTLSIIPQCLHSNISEGVHKLTKMRDSGVSSSEQDCEMYRVFSSTLFHATGRDSLQAKEALTCVMSRNALSTNESKPLFMEDGMTLVETIEYA